MVILGGFSCAIIFSFVTTWLFKLDRPVSSSVLQGSARHDPFIALAMAERLYGSQGLSMAALGVAILHGLVRNPILISMLIGLAVNLAPIGEIPLLHDIEQILGGAALPVVLLCIGANIRIRAMTGAAVPMVLAIIGKMIIFPGVVLILSQAVGLSDMATLIAVLFGSMPTAASSYTLARQMKGDAPLMAAIVTTQTGLAFISVPITLTLIPHLFGGN
jgi:malonate transporter and related proteins